LRTSHWVGGDAFTPPLIFAVHPRGVGRQPYTDTSGPAMEFDWNQVKKQTLWTYEELIKKLLNVLAYSFVQEYYNHTMAEAKSYSQKIQQGYRQNQNDTTFIDRIIASFKKLEKLQIETYLDLVHQVETREKCVVFLQKTGIDFDELIPMLNYVFRSNHHPTALQIHPK
jgi:hypothetical protein